MTTKVLVVKQVTFINSRLIVIRTLICQPFNWIRDVKAKTVFYFIFLLINEKARFSPTSGVSKKINNSLVIRHRAKSGCDVGAHFNELFLRLYLSRHCASYRSWIASRLARNEQQTASSSLLRRVRNAPRQFRSIFLEADFHWFSSSRCKNIFLRSGMGAVCVAHFVYCTSRT